MGGDREHKDGVREHLSALVTAAGFQNSEALAERLLILLEGAWVTAVVRRSAEPLEVRPRGRPSAIKVG